MKRIIATLVLSVFSCVSHAFSIDFNVTGGPVCQLTGPCAVEADVFRDPTGSWSALVNPDGTLAFAGPLRISFDDDTQFIELTVDGLMSPSEFNPPVVDGVVPTGNWYGALSYVTSSSGGVSTDFTIAENNGQMFFIDNEDNSFQISLNLGGDYPISLIVFGPVTASAVPVPAAAWLFGSAIGLLGWMRRRSV